MNVKLSSNWFDVGCRKLIESVTTANINDRLDIHNLINASQHVFIKSKSRIT